VSACSQLTETLKGLSTGTAASDIDQLLNELRQSFVVVPSEREHCFALVKEAALTAIRRYSDIARGEWAGEDALICTCFGVSETTIQQAISTQALMTVDDVTETCRAGSGCGSCLPLIEEILDGM
jgi:NifU-like protein